MDAELANYFFEEAAKAFDFIVRVGSFAPPQFEIDGRIPFAYAIFRGRNLALECSLDERDEDIDCKVVRLIDGKLPVEYAVDSNGVRVREGVYSLLRRKGVRERLFTQVTGLGLRDQIPITLGDFARMLKNHGSEIFSDSRTALD